MATTTATDAGTLNQLLDILCDGLFEQEVARGLTCSEAETIARFIREHRGDHEAAMFLYAHSWGDDDDTDVHAGMTDPRDNADAP